ncbi:hypothetical protein JCM10908_006445 [Rhodotorula pacifica]|uniref:ferric reductase family protein n=1 Tax=Rhodotorula pacifica TaxID=1495444 RepID=UPI00316B9C7B
MSVCWSASGVPEPCAGWNIYDSYKTDPRYQRYFTIAWTCTLALLLVTRLPVVVRSLNSARWRGNLAGWRGLFGVYEDDAGGYRRIAPSVGDKVAGRSVRPRAPTTAQKPFLAIAALVHSISRISLPVPAIATRILPARWQRSTPPSCHPTRTYLPFSLGHLVWILLISAFLLATLLPESQLRANPNRFGFLALACVPPIFVLSVKNGPVAWIVGRGWTAVNFLHRWLGRIMVLMVLLHFYFWTIQYSDRSAFLAGEKERRGIAALAFLLLIMISSLPPMRRFSYPIFFLLHYVGLIGFLVSVNRHTIYAGPWATYIVVAIYASDILGRAASMRIRWVEAEALEGGMVKISMPGVTAGWRGGQHLSVRLFFVPPAPAHPSSIGRVRRLASTIAHGLRSSVRPFEAHPLSIASAPPSDAVSLASDKAPRGIELYARSCGVNSWTDDLHRYVVDSARPLRVRGRSGNNEQSQLPRRRKVYLPCLFEGPYGGIPAHESPAIVNDIETVLLVAGGSGMSFVLGVLDSIVGRRLANGAAGRVEVVWVVRQRAHLAWFAERLNKIVSAAEDSPLRVIVRAFVTCDETLTAAIPAEASNPTPSSAGTGEETASPAEVTLTRFADKATISYIRPALRDIVRETVDRALAPCGHCYPVCRCGELASAPVAGMCANDEEECVGGCGGVANARELLDEENGEKKQGGGDDEKAEIDELPTLSSKVATSGIASGSCCSKKVASTEVDSISEIVETPAIGTSSCCRPAAASTSATTKAGCGGCCSRTTGGGCCTGTTVGPASPAGGDRDEQDRQEGKPLRVRTDGMAVVVCGPSNMVAETRNAVARIPLAKQVRIGGIACHVEQYSV